MITSKDPSIVIHQPAPGHFVITGHKPVSVATAEGTVVPIETCYVAPEVPSAILFDILGERGVFPPLLSIGPDGKVSLANNDLDIIRAEFPQEISVETPEQIAAVTKALFERNVSLTGRVGALENEKGSLAAERSTLQAERDELIVVRASLGKSVEDLEKQLAEATVQIEQLTAPKKDEKKEAKK